jgi:hypothetical protein
MTAVSATARAVRDLHVAVFGHSIGAFLFYDTLGWEFNRVLRWITANNAAANPIPNGMYILEGGAVGGSYLS